jgi:hypothetical protein
LDVCAIFDGGLLAFVKKVVGMSLAYIVRVLGFNGWASKQGDAMIVYICLVAEYVSRHHGEIHYLKNKCSTCHLVGHNSQNCPATNGVRGWKNFADDHYLAAGVDVAVGKCTDHVADKIARGDDDDAGASADGDDGCVIV